MGRSIRGCAPLLLLLAAAASAQLDLSRQYLTPDRETSNSYGRGCAPDRVLTTTVQQEVVQTQPRYVVSTVQQVSVVRQTRVQVQPTTLTQVQRVTVEQPVYVTRTRTENRVVYETVTRAVPGRTSVVTRTQYVPQVRTVDRTSVLTSVQVRTETSVRVVQQVRTVTSAGPRPVARTVYVTQTNVQQGPAVTVPAYRTERQVEVQTVPSPAVAQTVYNTQLVTVQRQVQQRGRDEVRTQTVRVPDVQVVTSVQRVPQLSTQVEERVVTQRRVVTDVRTSTVVLPVVVTSTVERTNVVTQTQTRYVTQVVPQTVFRTVVNTVPGSEVVRTSYYTATSVVTERRPQVTVPVVSVVTRQNVQRVTTTAVVTDYRTRQVEVAQPCKQGYNYRDQGNPLGL